ASTHTIDDFVGPDSGPAVKAAGLPYIKGGIGEVGGSYTLLGEAQVFSAIPNSWGRLHKQMMRAGYVRNHIAAISLVGEDMPQLGNRINLDPDVKDVYGFPVPRITRSAHKFERVASALIAPKLAAICA